MDLQTFLATRGADMPGILAGVRSQFGLDGDDVLLAVGSLVEGLGTPKSDVDLLLVTPREETIAIAGEYVSIAVGRCMIDLQIVRATAAERLLGRLTDWGTGDWDLGRSAKFSIDDRTLLHRLRHGHLLHRGNESGIVSRLPNRSDLARLKLHVARHLARTIQADMVGHRETGDYSSLVAAGQDLLGHTLDAVVASLGFTNPGQKWRSRLIQFAPPDWDWKVVTRPTGELPWQRFWRLHRAPVQPDPVAALDHALQITTFARSVFQWAEWPIVDHGMGVVAPLLWPKDPLDPSDVALPYLDLDVDFALSPGEVALGRVNEFDEPLMLSEREFAVALLFDGRTTRREAAAVVFSNQQDGLDIVDRLLTRLTVAGLVVCHTRLRDTTRETHDARESNAL